MNRNFSSEAVILSLKVLGENNSLVTMITKTRGIVKAMLYGGAKSKLRSLCTQWNSGIIYIYENPEKNQLKISDFDVKKYHLSFTESLFKSYASLLAAELVIKTECAGSVDLCWPIFNGFIDGLEIADEEQGKAGLVRFLWRFMEISGQQPDTEKCLECGKNLINSDENFQKMQNLYYNVKGNGFVCPECAFARESRTGESVSGQKFILSETALRYLHAVTFLSAKESRNMPLDKLSYEQIKAIVFTLAENVSQGVLNTIKTGMGIL